MHFLVQNDMPQRKFTFFASNVRKFAVKCGAVVGCESVCCFVFVSTSDVTFAEVNRTI